MYSGIDSSLGRSCTTQFEWDGVVRLGYWHAHKFPFGLPYISRVDSARGAQEPALAPFSSTWGTGRVFGEAAPEPDRFHQGYAVSLTMIIRCRASRPSPYQPWTVTSSSSSTTVPWSRRIIARARQHHD
ncbi:hypothetical protein GWI33_005317 [Rhynchophorus ferrugineus]|uniref:Uncharacterized protein n=1 Tax=Rhynchophorus ferrugineus TaxID=354439 RepID=A0A834ML10_RHYFE|nr:hypothetical protein GWI33_005317 [Rhynchophorus ferrugineus]